MSIECSICIVEYDEDDHRPMVGSCGHTVCSTCVRSREPCPICRTSHAFAQLVTNFEILRLARENGKLKEELGEFEKLEMENLDSQELSFIITSLRHCMHCDQKVQFGEIWSRACGCIMHLQNKYPSPRVRERHSSCDNSLKLELITIHMEKLFPNETIINGFRKLIAQNCPNLLLFIFGSKDSDDFTSEELWLMSYVWKICACCGAYVDIKKKCYQWSCGCLGHMDGECPFAKKRNHYSNHCSSSIKKEILADFVRTSYPGESVLSAFVKYMKNECPGIIEILKQDQNFYEKLELSEENKRLEEENAQNFYEKLELSEENQRLKEEIAQTASKNQELIGENERLMKENAKNTRLEAEIQNLRNEREKDKKQMKNETQKLARELESVRKELTKSEQNRKNSDQKWEETQATCDELKAENETVKKEHREEHLRSKKNDEKKSQQFAQILEDMEGQTEHFKQKLTELQENYNKLEEVNKRLEAEVQLLKNEREMNKKQCEEERKVLVEEKNEANEQLNRTSEKLAKINNELREIKRKWMEVRATDGSKTKEQALEESDDVENEEFMLNIEMNSFQPLFNEIQKKVSKLGKRVFSVRNIQTRRELTQKLTPATDISCEVEETVVTVLKNERDKLQTALDLLLSLETEFPAASSNQGIHPEDARLLD